MGGHFKIDTRATPYTLVWFSKPVTRLVPITRDFVGQDELTVSAWHTPGKELKFETNLPEFRTMKIISAGPTKEGLPGCCWQQPMDGRLQALQAGRVRGGLWIPVQDQVDRPWRDHQGIPSQGVPS